MPRETCACVSTDPYECWRARFGLHIFYDRIKEIEKDGGPCGCMCHDEWWGKEVRYEV